MNTPFKPEIVRRTVVLSQNRESLSDPYVPTPPVSTTVSQAIPKINIPESDEEHTVLVINSSQEMAKEITLQLTLAIPACSIMYAPTIELAKWILSRRSIDLVVSSAILPDGNISRLNDLFATMKPAPDVVVVGDLSSKNTEIFRKSGYEFSEVRRLGAPEGPKINRVYPKVEVKPEGGTLQRSIKTLGADLRNDLNNPLQEIVAMVFVAQASGAASPTTGQALEAIDRAAKNMADVVKGLEDKIKRVVGKER